MLLRVPQQQQQQQQQISLFDHKFKQCKAYDFILKKIISIKPHHESSIAQSG